MYKTIRWALFIATTAVLLVACEQLERLTPNPRMFRRLRPFPPHRPLPLLNQRQCPHSL